MSNKSPIIKINRKYHIPLDRILCVKQKKHGSVYVYYYDNNLNVKIAVSKRDIGTLLTVINTYLLALGKPRMLGIYEK